jgi:hypothetical protein
MTTGWNFVSGRTRVLTLICLLAATPGWSKVLLRWTQPSIPPAANMGINELVISWDAAALIRNARSQGYRVYAEVPVGKAADLARSAAKTDLAGIILNPGDSQPGQVDDELRQLQSANPRLPVLVLDPKGKQPQLKGQLVIKKDGVLQATSPTAQPWIDSNLALVRLDQAFRPGQTPLYEFPWDTSDPQMQEHGPDADDYALAVAEAGAFQADLVLDLHPQLQAGLVQNDPAAWAVIKQIKSFLAFSAPAEKNSGEPEANVGVVTDSYQKAYEPVNLFARHNIPFTVLKPSDLVLQRMERFALLVVFSAPDEPTNKTIADFAATGGIVVVVAAHGPYPWQSSQPVPAGEHSVAYAAGKGRVIELQGSIIDPETFAQDIRRLLDENKNQARGIDKLPISLWNALTVIAVPYRAKGEIIVDLVNYAQEPIPVQVQVKGSFSSVRYESPERACCASVTAVQRGAFTEFVIPALWIAGRVHLADGKPSEHKTEVK